MEILNIKEISLVSLGASIGSNCIPCVVYHIKQCKKCGFSDEQIKSAIDTAVKVKNIPADGVLTAALRQIETPGTDEAEQKCGC
jgi:4-carboxymuconolactone decarboxylase